MFCSKKHFLLSREASSVCSRIQSWLKTLVRAKCDGSNISLDPTFCLPNNSKIKINFIIIIVINLLNQLTPLVQITTNACISIYCKTTIYIFKWMSTLHELLQKKRKKLVIEFMEGGIANAMVLPLDGNLEIFRCVFLKWSRVFNLFKALG